MEGNLLIFSAPSGCGKSTIINHLMTQGLGLVFSISATSRPPRGQEQHGVDYYYITPDEFRAKIAAGEFVEWEEVYTDRYYGTLRSEVDGRMERGQNVVLDIDVNGALRVKEQYGNRALAIFIMPPSVEELRSRLEHRGTETAEEIDRRVARAEYEISRATQFDTIIVNDDLETAKAEAKTKLEQFLR